MFFVLLAAVLPLSVHAQQVTLHLQDVTAVSYTHLVARTDSRGRFSIRGIAPGKYRIYGLMDADQNFTFNQKSEMIAFHDSLIIPCLLYTSRCV